VENLWTLNDLLRGFQMAFMKTACDFLNNNEGSLPFKYLGLPVGANTNALSTWKPHLEHLKNRLNVWEIST